MERVTDDYQPSTFNTHDGPEEEDSYPGLQHNRSFHGDDTHGNLSFENVNPVQSDVERGKNENFELRTTDHRDLDPSELQFRSAGETANPGYTYDPEESGDFTNYPRNGDKNRSFDLQLTEETDPHERPPEKEEYKLNHPSSRSNRNHRNVNNTLDDSLDSVGVVIEDQDVDKLPPWQQDSVRHLKGVDNEAYAYDGDADTDLSHSFQGSPIEPPVMRNPDPAFPVLERPVSGRYQKNPTLERKKATAPQGPYDPHTGVFLTPPRQTPKPDSPNNTQVRRRIPRPPSKLTMKCAFFWSCLACCIGSFLCAIPALRYAVTANESRKIGDYNSAHSYLRKTAILAIMAVALGVGAWTVVILYLSGSL